LTWDALKLIIPAGVPLVIAAFGYWRAVVLARKSRRDQFVAETLVAAYLAIERYDVGVSEDNKKIEIAIAELQLLAPKEIAESVARSIRPNEKFQPTPELLQLIRTQLRRDLGLDSVKSLPMSLRFPRKNEEGR